MGAGDPLSSYLLESHINIFYIMTNKNNNKNTEDISKLLDVLKLNTDHKELERIQKINTQENKRLPQDQSWIVSDSSSSFTNLK